MLPITSNSRMASTGGRTATEFSFGSKLYAPSSRKVFESSRAPLTLNAKSPRTDPADPCAAGAAPIVSSARSRKLRPSSGRFAIRVRIEARGERCRRPVHGRRRRNRHGFRHLARLQHHVQAQALIDLERERLQMSAESSVRDFELIRTQDRSASRRTSRDHPCPHGLARTCGVAGDDDLGASDNATGRVDDQPLKRATHGLCGGSGGKYAQSRVLRER